MNSFVYVVQGQKILKVGRTIDIKNRLACIRREFAKHDDSIQDMEVFDAYGNEDIAEFKLLCFVKDNYFPYQGHEWFHAGDFEKVRDAAFSFCQEVKNIRSKNVVSRGGKENFRLVAEKRIISERAHRMQCIKDRSERFAKRKLLQTLRKIEIDCNAMWKRMKKTTLIKESE